MSLTKIPFSMIYQAPVNILDFIPVSEHAAIQSGTSTYDCSGDITSAIDSFTTALDTADTSYAGTVYFPPGRYYLANTVNIERQVILQGASVPAGNTYGASQFHVKSNTTGFVLHEYRTSVSGKSADGTVIENFGIFVNAVASGTGSAIWLRTRAAIRNCVIANFGEYGIRIEATSGGGSIQGNANLWEVTNVRVMGNGLDGLYVNGADANAGIATKVDSSSNFRHGIYDSSFLGNTYIACATDSNLGDAYKTDSASANSTWVGCYIEGGQTSSITSPSTIIGGFLAGRSGSALAQTYGNGDILGGKGTSLDGNNYFQIGAEGGVNESPMSFWTSALISGRWRFKYMTGRWAYSYYGGSAYAGTIFYDDLATVANGYPRQAYGGSLGMVRYYLGTEMKQNTTGSSAPTSPSETYVAGDIVWNTAPTAGGNVGWVCVSGGSPGTWKTFGGISA